MRISRIVYRLSLLNPRSEFLSILALMLFFPKSENLVSAYVYFLVLSSVIILFSIRNILFLKNIALSSFSHFLTVFNLVLIIVIFFSVYHFGSIYFYADIFLISFYSVLFFFDRSRKEHYFHSLTYMISLFSFLNIMNYYLAITNNPALFFTNTILQGIVSGIGVLIILYYILKGSATPPYKGSKNDRDEEKVCFLSKFLQRNNLKKFNWIFFILLIVNSGGVLVSHSKAAFIGCVVFAMLLFVLKNKKLILLPVILTILTFIIPNPIRDAFYFSLKKDPYAFDRINIWKVSIDIFTDNFLTGVGPDNFSQVSKKYNFRQTKGPANYFKVPRQTHNDYLKLVAETGIIGLIILVFMLFFIFRKIFSSSLFDITKVLILYLLFHAFLFNIIFHAFFFFLFIFLLKMLFEQELVFKSFRLNAKLVSFFLLIFLFLLCYLFPFLSNMAIERSKKSRDPVTALNSLTKAAYFNPLSIEPPYLQAHTFFNYFKQTANLEYFGYALDNIKKVQRLNRHFSASYLLESNLYYLLFNTFQSRYVSLDEIISPLSKAEKVAPLDPFIRMRKAQLYLEFNKNELAKAEALKALKVEPQFISALYFLHRNFNYFKGESVFKEKFKKVLGKIKGLSLKPGTYLYTLYEIPPELIDKNE